MGRMRWRVKMMTEKELDDKAMKKKQITPADIEALPMYTGSYHSSVLEEVSNDVESKDSWAILFHKAGHVKITKGEKITWTEVLQEIRDSLIRMEQEGKKFK